MKNYILILFSLLLFSCTDAKKDIIVEKKNIIKNDSIETVYGHLPTGIMNVDTLISEYRKNYNYEKIKSKTIYGDTIRFIYYHDHFNGRTDTLTIYKSDSLVLISTLKFISQKKIIYNGKRLIIKKYNYKGNSYIGDIYLSDSLGLLLCKYGQHIILYNTDNFSKIQQSVLNDSVFFNRFDWLKI